MVVYDFICRTVECPMSDVRFESLLKSWQSDDPRCPGCGKTLERQFPAPRLGWMTKPYADLDLKEDHIKSGNYCSEGIWVPHKNADGTLGKPRLARTPQEHKEFCKQEGYIYPADLPPNIEIDRDGKTLKSQGHSGQWV